MKQLCCISFNNLYYIKYYFLVQIQVMIKITDNSTMHKHYVVYVLENRKLNKILSQQKLDESGIYHKVLFRT